MNIGGEYLLGPEKCIKSLESIVVRPIKGLLAKIVEVTHINLDHRHHVRTIAEQKEYDRLQEHRRVTHVIGMSLAQSIKDGGSIEDQLLLFRDALDELPDGMTIRSVGLDEVQLGTLSQYFDIPPSEEL